MSFRVIPIITLMTIVYLHFRLLRSSDCRFPLYPIDDRKVKG